MEIDREPESMITGIAEGNNADYEIKEGLAKILISERAVTFYNPIQEFNRDLTIIVLRTFLTEWCNAQGEDAENRDVVSRGENREEKKRIKLDHEVRIKSPRNTKQSKCNGGIKILDALSASGLRAIRFALEVPSVEMVIANDFSENAVKAMQRNVELNNVQDKVRPVFSDAIDLMIEHRKFEKRFHAIDLDPYGSAAVFLDSAVQAVVDGGILMVTCTDTAILCGNTPEACFNKYGSVPLRHKSCHEIALRILLRAIDSHASRYGRYIVPLLSVSVDFYIRCFVQIHSGAAMAKDSVMKLAHVLSCATCHSLDFQPLVRKSINGSNIRFSTAHFQSNLFRNTTKSENQMRIQHAEQHQNPQQDGGGVKKDAEVANTNQVTCSFCGGSAIHMGGPIYVAPIHEATFVQKLLDRLRQTPADQQLGTHNRLIGMLTVISEELHDIALFCDYGQLMTVIKCSVPKMATFRSAILNAGFRCSGSHCNPKALKTDAPTSFIWDICRAWAKNCGMNTEKLKQHPVAQKILSKHQISSINFSPHKDAVPASKLANILRFQDNKGKNWGPKARAKGYINADGAGSVIK